MFDLLSRLFDSSGFPPRWQCGEWSAAEGWLHIASDLIVFAAYMSISVVLWYFARRRADWPFRHLLWLFGAFILACGTTHLMEAVIFWWPGYRLAGVLKAVTAVVSCATVVALVPTLPKALAMRTPEELEREVAARQAAETQLMKTNSELEQRVQERTAELTLANTALSEERERFRTTLASIGDAVIATDTSGRVTFVNPVAEDHTGWSAEAALGQPLREVFHIVNETTRNPVDNPAAQALREGIVVGLANHTVLIGRNGHERAIDDCASPIRDQGGRVAGAVLVFRDVTSQRRIESEQAEQARFTALRADIATALATASKEEVALRLCCEALVEHLDAAFARIWIGLDGTDMLSLRASAGLYTHLDGPHSRIRVGQSKIGRIAANGKPHATNAIADDPDISDRAWAAREGIVAFAGHPLTVEERVVGVVAVFARRPLSANLETELARSADAIAQYIERRRAEERLRQSEERYRLLFEAHPHPMWVFDRETLAFLAVNDAAVSTYGYDREEFLTRTIKDIRPVEDVPKLLASLAVDVDGYDNAGLWRHRAKNGRLFWVRITSHTMHFAGRRAEVVLAQDVTEQLQAEEELRASEERYRTLVSAMAEGVVFQAPDSTVLMCNKRAERILGLTAAEVAARTSFDPRWQSIREDGSPFYGEDHPSMVALRTGQPCEGVVMGVRRPDGTLVWISINAQPLIRTGETVPYGVVCSFSDITGRKSLEAQFRQAQKLEAIGRLAGGVAHDFNNLLTVVNGCTELLLDDLPADSPARPLAESIIAAGERGAALTRQLLAFSRQQMLRVEVFDLNRVLTETAKLLARLLGEDINLRLVLDPTIGFVRADVGQIDQVVINLAVNARDAMPKGGSLVIDTQEESISENGPLPSPDARPGRYVRLTVTDTGEGMPPEVQVRLFEPFFTTKPIGHGTGLGLATVYGIVRQSGGFVTVNSEVGHGTKFAVYLPRHDVKQEVPKSVVPTGSRKSGRETILIVEDDDAVRALATTVLTNVGYRVEAAQNGEAAIAICDRLSSPPDLVLTDVVMPGMGGRELAERLTAKYPRLKVVFLSGYTVDAVLRHGVEEEQVAFLQKPYTPDVLTHFVRQTLDRTT